MSFRQIWGTPIVIAVLSTIGVLSALLGDGLWDVLSWLSLTAPVAVALWHVGRSLKRSRRTGSCRSRSVK